MFLLSKLAWYLAAPGNLLVLLLFLGCCALLLRRVRLGAALIAVATAAAIVVLLTPAAQWALAPLENRFPAPALPAHIDGMVVLGGAVDLAISVARQQPAVNDAAERLIGAAALSRRYPDAKIVLSGGEGWWSGPRSEAEVARDLLISLGIPADRMVLESKSRNTFENATDSFALIRPKRGQVWLLVTSAFHMPRAVGCFRDAGWPVIPYPVDYRTAQGGAAPDHFLAERLYLLDLATKEWVGLAAYYLAGRIPELFPGP